MKKWNVPVSASLLVMAIWNGKALAAIDLAEMDQITARRTELSQRENAIRQMDSGTADLSTQFAAIKSIQSEMVMGSSGLKKDVESWLTNADAWLTQWKNIAEGSKLINRSNFASFGIEVQDKIEVLNRDYFKLAQAALQIADRSALVATNLKGRPLLQEASWPKYADFVKTLNQRHSELIATVDTLSTELEKEKVKTLQKQMTLVSDYVIAQITLLAIQFPELEAQIAETKAFIQFSKEMDPKIVDFEYGLNKGIALVDTGFLFTALDREKVLVAQSAKLLQEIGSFEAGDQIRKLKAERITTGLKTFQDKLKAKVSQGSMAKAVGNLAKTERARLTALCRKSMSWSGVDCEMLRVLNSVDMNFFKIQKWSQADLAYFEKMLYQAGQGSTIVNTGASQ
ncbi:MAG TPA: hypothetical protein VE954_18435 [Oligoflexus sp.]|uniref:hypothetical protein n=1 Tax=Oligoflexus sp. TaxID=1971216 RepID=UPI002D69C9E0|nr:hypothetical protein [Oligoflexus sp.]HYX35080.1 hypothetical protein [Oligoflexus sp.]